ncbi:MAG: DUF4230 domain-containing protein [Sandaracinus sp.]|nr:DUF4230 domain-containing protein [Sandaracinus sp.]
MELRPRKSYDGVTSTPTATAASPEHPPADRGASEKIGPLRAIGWLFAFGLLAAGLLVGALLYRLLAPPPEAPATVETVRSGAATVTAIRDLARLQTATFHMERVIDLQQRQQALFGLVEVQDAILLVAAAEVSAGVDLTQMRDGDVTIEPDARRATIVLPAPEIFDARLDNERTYVHTRQTDTLARRSDTLETRARRAAEDDLERAAVDAGILERARENARAAITTLVRALGYDEVEVRFADQPATNDTIAPAARD